jgi:hypothetical protein
MQTLICGRSKVDTVRGGATRRSEAMRGADGMQEVLFTVAKLEDFVPPDHPLRPIRLLVNQALMCPKSHRFALR